MAVKKKTVNWFFEGKEIKSIADCDPKALGFIYEITNITKNKRYLGRKTIRKPNYTSGINKGKSKGVYVFTTYCGSSKSLLEDIKNGDEYKKEIIRWCYSKAELTYYESKSIYCSDSLLREDFYNFWCKATVYSKHLNAPKKE
jgi:hypothetical protein